MRTAKTAENAEQRLTFDDWPWVRSMALMESAQKIVHWLGGKEVQTTMCSEMVVLFARSLVSSELPSQTCWSILSLRAQRLPKRSKLAWNVQSRWILQSCLKSSILTLRIPYKNRGLVGGSLGIFNLAWKINLKGEKRPPPPRFQPY